MSKTIAKLWNGDLVPIKQFGKTNEEMKNLRERMQNSLEKLEKILDEKEAGVFSVYNDRVTEYFVVACEQAFCDGFRLGTKVTAEAMSEAPPMTT